MAVALLADLRDDQLDLLAEPHAAAEPDAPEVDAADDHVLGEVARPEVGELLAPDVDLLGGEQAHGAVALAGVRVALDAVVDDEGGLLDHLLRRALALADADGLDASRHGVSPSSRLQSPDLPPVFSRSRTRWMVMSFEIALHMS
jgi:hypothetical protein